MNNEVRILEMLETVLSRMDGMDQRFAAIDARFVDMQSGMDQCFGAVLAQQQQMNARLDTLEDAIIAAREELTVVKRETADTRAAVVRIESEHGA